MLRGKRWSVATCSEPCCEGADIHRSLFADLLQSTCCLKGCSVDFWICLSTTHKYDVSYVPHCQSKRILMQVLANDNSSMADGIFASTCFDF